jgi:hypothetical protein
MSFSGKLSVEQTGIRVLSEIGELAATLSCRCAQSPVMTVRSSLDQLSEVHAGPKNRDVEMSLARLC